MQVFHLLSYFILLNKDKDNKNEYDYDKNIYINDYSDEKDIEYFTFGKIRNDFGKMYENYGDFQQNVSKFTDFYKKFLKQIK